MNGRQLRALHRLLGNERRTRQQIIRRWHKDGIRGVSPTELGRYRETTYADLRRAAKKACRDLHCWEDGPRDEETWVGSTCMRVVDKRTHRHSGAHRWISDDRIGVTFAPAGTP